MPITASGVGSGIDVDGIITQLMALEREPINRLQAKKARLEVELSAFASTKGLLNELASAAGTLGDRAMVAPFLAESGDAEMLTASATGNATESTHEIEVLSLASTHRVASGGHDSENAAIGSGSWDFSSGGNAFQISLPAGQGTLASLRDAINGSADNTSIDAMTLAVDGGTRLVLTARDSGGSNAITASRSGYGATTFEEVVAAQDALLRVDGFAVTRSSNSIGDVIDGVTLELSGPGRTTLSTRRDTEAMSQNLAAFVEKYNALREEMSSLSEGGLQGDRLPRDIDLALRRAFSEEVELGDGRSFAPVELGFSFDRYGVLSLDQQELSARQSEGFDALIAAFSRPEDGFAARIEGLLQRFTSTGGQLGAREAGVESRQNTLDATIEQKEYRMQSIEARYRRQFASMDALVGSLQTTSSFLADRLGR